MTILKNELILVGKRFRAIFGDFIYLFLVVFFGFPAYDYREQPQEKDR
jgi:hypothetical protein